MTLKLKDKKVIVADVAKIAKTALSAVAAGYRGLTVAEMTELRAQARGEKVYLRIIRNTLARIAVENTEFSCFKEALTGPLFLAFSLEDPGAAARLLRDFAKKHEKLEIKFLSIGGKLLGSEQLADLANLPNREQALAILMSALQSSILKLARTMAEPYAKLTRVVAAIRDKKQAD